MARRTRGERVRPIRFDQGIGAVDRETCLSSAVDREPALRRAVPTLINRLPDYHLLGAFVQVVDQSRQKRASMKRDVSALADLLAERLDPRSGSIRPDRAVSVERLQKCCPTSFPGVGHRRGTSRPRHQRRRPDSWPAFPLKRHLAMPTRILDVISAAQLLTLPGQQAGVTDMILPTAAARWRRCAWSRRCPARSS